MRLKEDNLKNLLKEFYETNIQYFQTARDVNIDLPEERKRMLAYLNKEGYLLDVACGTAENSLLFKDNSQIKYIGVDIGEAGLKMAKDYESKNVKFIKADVENLPFKNNAFENVICTYSLEHFTNPKKAIDEMIKVLKKNGYLIIIAVAFDFNFPKSIASQFSNRNRSFKYFVRKVAKELRIVLEAKLLKKFNYSPEIIKTIDLFKKKFESDLDTVYDLLTLEIYHYLKDIKGLKIGYLETPFPKINVPFSRIKIPDFFIQIISKFEPFKFWGNHLYIVAQV